FYLAPFETTVVSWSIFQFPKEEKPLISLKLFIANIICINDNHFDYRLLITKTHKTTPNHSYEYHYCRWKSDLYVIASHYSSISERTLEMQRDAKGYAMMKTNLKIRVVPIAYCPLPSAP
uniref:Uncharacterized protein n=1 Tax=Parascaris univalens TaxID=6257 RepID=A0A915A4J9_PARUN